MKRRKESGESSGGKWKTEENGDQYEVLKKRNLERHHFVFVSFVLCGHCGQHTHTHIHNHLHTDENIF